VERENISKVGATTKPPAGGGKWVWPLKAHLSGRPADRRSGVKGGLTRMKAPGSEVEGQARAPLFAFCFSRSQTFGCINSIKWLDFNGSPNASTQKALMFYMPIPFFFLG